MEITPNRIKAFRIAKGMTQQDLATILGQHWSCVSGWERGKWGPTKKVLPKLVKMIFEWESKAEPNSSKNLKIQLKQVKVELKRYQVLCTKQERMIEQLLRSKESK